MENNNSTYIIGEIGQNHNGSVDIAKLIIDVASRPVIDDLFGTPLKSMDAVKLTMRDLKYELSDSQMNKPYDTPQSFGATYGEHRDYLELSHEEHFECYKYAKEKGLDMVETLCAPSCLAILKMFTPDRLKVASRDLTNLPLLAAMAETKIPMIMSTGMAGDQELDNALEVITKYHSDISILHCLSEYPSRYKNINLKTITYLQKKYPQFTIGYSDHSIGISIPMASVAMGAKIVEKHITLDRDMKGTDQKGSLAIDGIRRMVRGIRNLEHALGTEGMFVSDSVASAKAKLQRSIATNQTIKKGEFISLDKIHMLSPGDGVQWIDKDSVIGKQALNDIPENEIIYSNLIG